MIWGARMPGPILEPSAGPLLAASTAVLIILLVVVVAVLLVWIESRR